MAESSEQKLHFAQENGFKKLLQLLLNKNEKSAKAVSAAMLHFLTVTSSPIIEEKESEAEEKLSISLKLRKIVEDLRNLTFSELKKSVVDEKPVINDPNDSQKVQQLTCPSSDDFFQCDLFTIMLLDSQFPKEEIKGKAEEEEEKDNEENKEESTNNGVLTLITALKSSDPNSKCELLKTLPRILNEENNRKAFLKNSGNEILFEIADEMPQESIEIFFACLEEIIVDKIRVKEPFFFQFLFRLLEISTLKELVLVKIEDILMRDWRNVILALRMKLPLYMS